MSSSTYAASSNRYCKNWAEARGGDELGLDEVHVLRRYAPLGAGGSKYRPDQARDDHSRWADEGGGEDEAGREITFNVGTGPRPPSNDMRTVGSRSGGADDAAKVILAADRGEGFNADLREEEARGGHPVSEHVGKSEEKLQRRVESEAIEAMQKGDRFRGFAAGSFYNLQSANKLANATLSSNSVTVDEVGRGALPFAIVEHHFNSPTGYEVYLDRLHAQPYRRTTYGVRVFVLRDPQSPRGFRVQSAFPVQ